MTIVDRSIRHCLRSVSRSSPLSIQKKLLATFLFLLFLVCQYFTPSLGDLLSVSTINSRDGDIIDCIRQEDQPAIGHPLLKNHIIQEYPTGFIRTDVETEQNWQVWHETGETCPVRTIPIRREVDQSQNIDHIKIHPKKFHVVPNEHTVGHKYAIGYLENHIIYGTKVTLNVWDPIVEAAGDFSLTQIWLASGSYDSGDLNTIEAGWQVYPSKYLDNQPRLFTYWTKNGYNQTGCYNMECSGFVQTSRKIALQAAISRTSTFEETQLDITIQILKDELSGNWWLSVGHNPEPVGYWPAAIFTNLSDHATRVDWGGEVLYRNMSGLYTKAEMGSGEFADQGFRKAAYLCNMKVAEDNRQLLPVDDFKVVAFDPQYYTVKKSHNKQCGTHFYYGGPGPQLSLAIYQALASVSLCFFGLVVFLII